MRFSEATRKYLVISLAGVSAFGLVGILYAHHKKKSKKVDEGRDTESQTGITVQKAIPEKEYNAEEKVYLKDPDGLEEKIFRIKASGVDNLQVIADFDQTLTCFNYNNKPCSSCWSMFQTSSLVSPEFAAKIQANVLKYMPIENDPLLSSEEKIHYLEEWWKVEEEMLATLKLNKENLSLILEESNLALRHGFGSFIKAIDHVQIPIYIVSGGILDFMKPVLKQYMDIESEQVKLFGNVMEFNKKGHFKSFKAPHLHSLHKEKILSKENTEAKFRKNAILIGDTINDRFMTSQLNLDVVLSIGFLDDKKKEHLDHYIKAYDIVIVGDGNFTQIEAIARELLGLPQRNAIKKLLRNSDTPLMKYIFFEE